MMKIEGEIITRHRNASCIARAIRPDNLLNMITMASGDEVKTVISGTKLRSLIASVDDYLMNLAIAEELCRYGSD
jgi:hypothetical protein